MVELIKRLRIFGYSPLELPQWLVENTDQFREES